MATRSPFVDEAVESALDRLQFDYAPYARAMILSTRLDSSTRGNPRPASPFDIYRSCGLALKAQLSLKIVLNKSEAISFLRSIGLDIDRDSFKRRYTRNSYKVKFDREIAKTQNRIICTYAEWLHWTEYEHEIKIPSSLLRYLEGPLPGDPIVPPPDEDDDGDDDQEEMR